jgi:hypothetical protein
MPANYSLLRTATVPHSVLPLAIRLNDQVQRIVLSAMLVVVLRSGCKRQAFIRLGVAADLQRSAQQSYEFSNRCTNFGWRAINSANVLLSDQEEFESKIGKKGALDNYGISVGLSVTDSNTNSGLCTQRCGPSR